MLDVIFEPCYIGINSHELARKDMEMFERILNAKICKLQAQLVAKYGDCQQVSEIIRKLTAEAKATKNTTCFDQYKV